MPKSEPAITHDDLAKAAAVIIAAVLGIVFFAWITTHYRITRTIDSVNRIEQKVNQCQP